MGVGTKKAPEPPPGAGTANDRFRAGHESRLHWSVLASVLLHVAVFVGWPDSRAPAELRQGLQGAGYLEVLSLSSDDAPAPSGAAPRLVEAPDGAEDASSEDARSQADALEADAIGWEHIPASLQRLAALRPELADSLRLRDRDVRSTEADSPDRTSQGTGSEALRIRLEAAELDLQQLSEEERLSLERLSAYRPELVVSPPGNWLVLRNPDEVGAFMQARLGIVDSRADERGSIGVAIWVDELGSVQWAEIIHSSGDPRVDGSVLEMFRTVVSFRPAREDGARVSVAAIYWLMW
jgi:TonB family protein